MKKIVCECCYRETPIWVVGKSVRICEVCRLAAIEWMMNMGFKFSHPFIREITNVIHRRNLK